MRQGLETSGPEPALVRQAWAEWLGTLPWNLFLTITFDAKKVNPAIYRHPDRPVHYVGKWLRARLSPYSRLFLASEAHLAGNYHVHGLYSGSCNSTYKLWRDLYLKYGLSRVEVVKSRQDVASYLTKYVAKALTYYYIW